MNFLSTVRDRLKQLDVLDKRMKKMQEALGRIESRQLQLMPKACFSSNEFQVYSQWGEDGLIQFLVNNIELPRKVFVEFGVENYTESNTRFLLINNGWSGLVIDGSRENIEFLKNDDIYWRYNIKAECAFITKDNINQILENNGIQGEIGILSVDIDGNDYWVWDAIDSIDPAIVIVEYNARFGTGLAVTVPYDPDFIRAKAHYSMIYYGASLRAMCFLGRQKGYAFVGCNSAGNNAFFVRRDLMKSPLMELTVEEGFIGNQFRESRDKNGNLAFLTMEEEAMILKELPVIDVEQQKRIED